MWEEQHLGSNEFTKINSRRRTAVGVPCDLGGLATSCPVTLAASSTEQSLRIDAEARLLSSDGVPGEARLPRRPDTKGGLR